MTELKRRSLLKSIIWRVIGIAWTWIGAYFIILLLPPNLKNAPVIATLIVDYNRQKMSIEKFLNLSY